MRVLALLLPLVVLAGCVGPPVVTPVPTPTATPVFASDEEALAAAEEAYAAYLAVSDELSADGWAEPSRLAPFLTDEELNRTERVYDDLHASGRSTVGTSVFDSTMLQRYDDGEVAVYLCLDVSGVRVVDSSGLDVTSVDRVDRVALEVVFKVVRRKLLLDSSDIWDGGALCRQ